MNEEHPRGSHREFRCFFWETRVGTCEDRHRPLEGNVLQRGRTLAETALTSPMKCLQRKHSLKDAHLLLYFPI